MFLSRQKTLPGSGPLGIHFHGSAPLPPLPTAAQEHDEDAVDASQVEGIPSPTEMCWRARRGQGTPPACETARE